MEGLSCSVMVVVVGAVSKSPNSSWGGERVDEVEDDRCEPLRLGS